LKTVVALLLIGWMTYLLSSR